MLRTCAILELVILFAVNPLYAASSSPKPAPAQPRRARRPSNTTTRGWSTNNGRGTMRRGLPPRDLCQTPGALPLRSKQLDP